MCAESLERLCLEHSRCRGTQWRISGALVVVGVSGAAAVLEVKGDGREGGRENPVKLRPSGVDRIDVLLKRHVRRQLETLDIAC
jgi:hypothetical protein